MVPPPLSSEAVTLARAGHPGVAARYAAASLALALAAVVVGTLAANAL